MLLGRLAQMLPDLPQDDPDNLHALAEAMAAMANRNAWFVELLRGGSPDPLLRLVPELCRRDALAQGGAV